MKKKFTTLIHILILLNISTSIFANTTIKEENTKMIQTIFNNKLVPSNYELSEKHTVTVDGELAELSRFIRKDGKNTKLGGEHFSILISDAGKLKGFTHMSLDLVSQPLPSKQKTEEIAINFLTEHAPDLLDNMKINWIEPHDESISVLNDTKEQTVTITGMKLKALNLNDNRWFWVIVGRNNQPIVFERDIVWISFPGKRQTEKWLHDSWLLNKTDYILNQN